MVIILFNSDALRRHTEGENGLVVDRGNAEVALGDDVHAYEHVVVAVVLAAQHRQIGYAVAVLEAEVYEVGVRLDDAAEGGEDLFAARSETQGLHHFGRNDGVSGSRVPRGVLYLAVAAVAVAVGHAFGHHHEAIGDDGILPAAVFLDECAHLGSMQALMV